MESYFIGHFFFLKFTFLNILLNISYQTAIDPIFPKNRSYQTEKDFENLSYCAEGKKRTAAIQAEMILSVKSNWKVKNEWPLMRGI